MWHIKVTIAITGLTLWLATGLWALEPERLKKECSSGIYESCTELGLQYMAAGNSKSAAKFLGRACRGGNIRGCYMLTRLNKEAKKGHEERAFRFARKTLIDGCKSGNPKACFYAATVERRLKHYTEAASLYERGCNLKDGRSCSTLGYLYASGKGVAKEPSRAIGLFRKGCGLKDPSGCFNLALMLRRTTDRGEEDYSRSVDPFKKSCELGMARGCFNLGVIYSTGKGVKRDHGLAKGFFHKACKGGDREGCFNAGLMYLEGKDFDVKTAMGLLKRACSMGYSKGCDAYRKLKEEGL